MASVLALVLAVVGGIASVTHLSHPDRIMAVLSHPTAGIFLEALLIGLFIAAVAVYVILLKRDASAGAAKRLPCWPPSSASCSASPAATPT